MLTKTYCETMLTKTYCETKAHAEEVYLFRTTNPTNQVHWFHVDGSNGCWHGAFVEVYFDWFIIYTHHHDFFVYHKNDLISLSEIDLTYQKFRKFGDNLKENTVWNELHSPFYYSS